MNQVQEVITRSGRIDVLINNAGFSYIGLNEACTLADLQQQCVGRSAVSSST
jgi:short-subunit dehydrogenase